MCSGTIVETVQPTSCESFLCYCNNVNGVHDIDFILSIWWSWRCYGYMTLFSDLTVGCFFVDEDHSLCSRSCQFPMNNSKTPFHRTFSTLIWVRKQVYPSDPRYWNTMVELLLYCCQLSQPSVGSWMPCTQWSLQRTWTTDFSVSYWGLNLTNSQRSSTFHATHGMILVAAPYL